MDARLANSPWKSRTEPERAFAASFVKQPANSELLLLIVGSVVFATLLLVATPRPWRLGNASPGWG